ncbi:MAG: preprotein translocase subunit SecG [Mycoplasma sp.]|nr:preprotein translocase subunit SecG [Mycoplasma sp.]
MGITILMIILFIVSFLMIIIGFMMAPDSNSFSGALIGSSDLKLFSQTKEQGWKKFLKWSMITLGIIIFVVTIIIRVFI